MSLQALQYREYTSASDVWSYGMVLFEIWSLGHRPFDACTLENDVSYHHFIILELDDTCTMYYLTLEDEIQCIFHVASYMYV